MPAATLCRYCSAKRTWDLRRAHGTDRSPRRQTRATWVRVREAEQAADRLRRRVEGWPHDARTPCARPVLGPSQLWEPE